MDFLDFTFTEALLAFQAFCVIHALRKGYSHSFVLLVLVPIVGAIGYCVVEFGPALYDAYLRQTFKKIRQSGIHRELIEKYQAAALTPTIENRHALATCYLSLGDYEQALCVLDQLLTNQFSHDPYLLLDKAKALFGLARFNEARFILNSLQSQMPAGHTTYAQVHLLYARSLAALGETHLADHEFEKLQQYYTGLEASYYYLKYLRELNHDTRAEQVLKHMRKRLHRLPKHFQQKERSWLKQAQKD